MARGTRPHVLHTAADVPPALVDELIGDMRARMSLSPEARRCEGLRFAFELTDVDVAPALYSVGKGGRVTLRRGDTEGATFSFRAGAQAFDDVLQGRGNGFGALMSRHISMRGSLLHIRGILRMLPAVTRAWTEARTALIERHSDRYEFRF